MAIIRSIRTWASPVMAAVASTGAVATASSGTVLRPSLRRSCWLVATDTRDTEFQAVMEYLEKDMSTRACYQFKDKDGIAITVYKHHDGYPSGAKEAIEAAIPFAWHLPRFEASDFGAAFVAANRQRPSGSGNDCCGGGVRLIQHLDDDMAWKRHGDIAYLYVVTHSRDEGLMVEAYTAVNDFTEAFYSGPLAGLETARDY